MSTHSKHQCIHELKIVYLKMNEEQANLFLRFDGYLVYYKPRNIAGKRADGTVLVVKKTIDHSLINGLDKKLDHIGLKVTTNDFCFNLLSLYAPSDSLKKLHD